MPLGTWHCIVGWRTARACARAAARLPMQKRRLRKCLKWRTSLGQSRNACARCNGKEGQTCGSPALHTTA
eukprot:207491-Lingulodinium_polyedra.AAC.1